MSGIDPSSVNVSDLAITRPSRTGPGGDEVGDATVIGSELQALRVEENKVFQTGRGREIVSLGRFFLDPILDDAGDPVEILPGDFAAWTNAFGSAVEAQEIVSVEPTTGCDGLLDVVTFRVGRTRALVE